MSHDLPKPARQFVSSDLLQETSQGRLATASFATHEVGIGPFSQLGYERTSIRVKGLFKSFYVLLSDGRYPSTNAREAETLQYSLLFSNRSGLCTNTVQSVHNVIDHATMASRS